MNTAELIEQLQAEQHRIDAVIKLPSGSETIAIAPIMAPKPPRKGKKMSAAGRKRISEAQKKRWEKQKKAA